MTVIKELENEQEWRRVFPIVRQLRTNLDESDYVNLAAYARKNEGYRLFALYDEEGAAASVVGFMPMTTLYNGRAIWVCDLVTDQAKRSKGYGRELLSFVHDWAGRHGFSVVSLSSGLQRTDAHRFYQEKMGYDRVSFVFKKVLDRLP